MFVRAAHMPFYFFFRLLLLNITISVIYLKDYANARVHNYLQTRKKREHKNVPMCATHVCKTTTMCTWANLSWLEPAICTYTVYYTLIHTLPNQITATVHKFWQNHSQHSIETIFPRFYSFSAKQSTNLSNSQAQINGLIRWWKFWIKYLYDSIITMTASSW